MIDLNTKQGSWLHDHEIVSMCAIFLLGYVSIIFENIFEFNKVRACVRASPFRPMRPYQNHPPTNLTRPDLDGHLNPNQPTQTHTQPQTQAAVGLLMAVALWVIYAGTAGAQGVAVASALHELSEHVSEVQFCFFSLVLVFGGGGRMDVCACWLM